jgi:membrane-associated phospholipid phosphatase
MWVGSFCAAALMVTSPWTNKVLHFLWIAGCGSLWLLSALAGMVISIERSHLPWAFIAIGLVYAGVVLILALRFRKTEGEALRKSALVGLLLLVAALVIINILKILWGRPRMVTMTDPDSQFTPWFLPQGIAKSDAFKSFPSGHSATASVIIWITLLPSFIPRLRTRGAKIALSGIAYAWIILVMLSRIIAGAHFASDTLMGAGITLASFYWLKRWIIKS